MVQNELRAEKDDATHWRFRKVEVKSGKSETWEVVQTKEGEVQHLLAIDGHPLTAAQRRDEEERLRKYVRTPAEQDKRRQASSSDSSKEQSLLKMLPQALLYHYQGKQNDLIRLTFTPNPRFHASTHEEEVFHHMMGQLVFDEKKMRLVELRGRIASRVDFGYGILGHLDKGGTFDVRQADVGDGHWDVTLLQTDLTGKALFFRTITVHEKLVESDYRRVPDNLTLQQGARLLTKNDRLSASLAQR